MGPVADPGFFGGGDGECGSTSLYWGSGGIAPSGVQGQRPWSGGQGASPPEADDIFAFKEQFKQ